MTLLSKFLLFEEVLLNGSKISKLFVNRMFIMFENYNYHHKISCPN